MIILYGKHLVVWQTSGCGKAIPEEIFAQHIFKKILADYNIVKTDIGGTSQHDLLAIGTNHKIAIEITNAVNQNGISTMYYLQNTGAKKSHATLRYHWIINIAKPDYAANNTQLLKKKILPILIKLEVPPPALNTPIECDYFYATPISKNSNGDSGSYEIVSINEIGDASPKHILEIIHNESQKKDNIKKLSLADAHEKHLAIVIGAFKSAAAIWITQYFTSEKEFSMEFLETMIPNFSIPDKIDVIWLLLLVDFNPSGEMGYHVAKFYKKNRNIFILERMSDQMIKY